MTSRERVRLAINHKEADRVPIDLCGTNVTGIHVAEYEEIVKYLELDSLPGKVYDQFQFLARADDSVRSALHSDVIELENLSGRWGNRNKDWKFWDSGNGRPALLPGDFNPVCSDGYWDIRDGKGSVTARMPYGGLYFDKICYTEMTADFSDHLMKPKDWYDSLPLLQDEELRILEKRAKLLFECTDYSLHGGLNNMKLFSTSLIAGQTISNWLCLLLMEEEYCAEILGVTAQRAVENLALYLQAVGKYIDTVLVSTSDYGSQNAEMFSPDIFKRLYLPNLKKVNEFIHKNSEVKAMYHSCGSIGNIIGYMVEAGVDILNPIQVSCANMNPADLKQKYGDKLVFWGGGVDTQTTMQFGSADDVRGEVKERLDIFAPGGGYVFAPVHNLQYGVPVKNVFAMLDVAANYRY